MSSPEVAKELAKALGVREAKIQIRQTEDKLASVIDAVRLFLGLDANQAAERVRQICERYSEVKARIFNLKFKGRGQRDTPVTDLATLYEILMLLPGRMAAQCRRQAARLLIRYLGGDLSLSAEVEENRKLQERLAAEDPGHPLRRFGLAVEAEMESDATDVIHPKDSEADPKGDFLYGMKVPGQPDLLKVGRTKDVTRRERALSCGHVEAFRATVVFPGAGPLEKHVHRFLQQHQVQNEVFRITSQELKGAVQKARVEYAREQYLEELRAEMSLSDPAEDFEEGEPTSNKRRRLAEDLDIEERRMALEHTRAMNTLELQSMIMSLREREVRLTLEIEERRAKLQMELQERAAKLPASPPQETVTQPERSQADLEPMTTQPMSTTTPEGGITHGLEVGDPDMPDTRDAITKLLGAYHLVERFQDATPKSSPQFTQRMKQSKMGPGGFNQALRELGFDIRHSRGVTRVRRQRLWVRLQ